LKYRYPLDPTTENFIFRTIREMQDLLQETVASQMKIQLPEKAQSEICQIYFYVAINIENLLDPRYKPGIDLINKNFSKQLANFQNDLQGIALSSINKGVPKAYILEYLCMYFESGYKKVFPNQPLIIG